MDDRLNSISVVTGASSGLGRSIVLELISQNKNVAAIARDISKLEILRSELRTSRLIIYRCDLSSYVEVVDTVKELTNNYQVKCLYNIAGAPAYSKIEEIDCELLEGALSSNLKSVIYITSALLKELKNNTPSTILTTLTTTALKGRPLEAAYAAAKWGVRGYMECLREDCRNSGVRVISVFPGAIDTPFWAKQNVLTPNPESYIDPDELASELVKIARGLGKVGYYSSVVIERY